MEELRQLAELAKRDPAIMQQIQHRQATDAMLRIHTLEEDEFHQLEELTQEDEQAMETNYFDKLAAEHHNPVDFMPCPFCQAMTRHTVKNLDGKHQVFCVTCDAHGPKESTEEKALEAWNKAPRK
jgi:Lar family restriction alleviation protein